MQGLIRPLLAAIALLFATYAIVPSSFAQSTEQPAVQQAAPPVKIDRRKLLVQPKNADGTVQEVPFLEDPVLWAREKQPFAPVTEFGQIWSNDKLELHFQVPLKTPLDPRAGEVVLKVYDPDFFIAFDYAKDDPVTVIGNIPQPCKLVVKSLPTNEEVEQTRSMLATKGTDWKPENNEDFGALFAQPVTVQCKV